jgi:hypothetical protein
MLRSNTPRHQLLALVGFAAAVCLVAPASADVLVYKDGDRLQGHLVSDDGTTLVFQSPRFGELRVPVGQAKVQREPHPKPVAAAPSANTAATPAAKAAAPAAPPAAPPASASPASTAVAENGEHAARVEQRAQIGRVEQQLRKFFGPWHGRLAASTELVQGDSSRRSVLAELRIGRKWAIDELRMEATYEFRSTEGRTDTDLIRSNASWHHDLSARWFLLAHPRLELNRHYQYLPQDSNMQYLLLHQELGAGAFLIKSKKGKLSLGISGNQYDLWTLSSPYFHESKFNPAVFIEAELNLRWGIRLTERGVRYISLNDRSAGWESEFELGKKLTETLTLALHHDVRFNDPDLRVQDNSTWRMLLGFDF